MKPENPPAFPTDGRIQHGTAYDGMSLRDWFAGQALGNICAAPDAIARANWTENPERFVADWSYRLADAMLAARQETPDAE